MYSICTLTKISYMVVTGSVWQTSVICNCLSVNSIFCCLKACLPLPSLHHLHLTFNYIWLIWPTNLQSMSWIYTFLHWLWSLLSIIIWALCAVSSLDDSSESDGGRACVYIDGTGTQGAPVFPIEKTDSSHEQHCNNTLRLYLLIKHTTQALQPPLWECIWLLPGLWLCLQNTQKKMFMVGLHVA